jgi:patatin-like phospholipase/acyl hydrolase
MYILTYNIDGGSAGGLSQIFILYEIGNRIKFDLGLDELPRLCDYFDMIGGVGMGGYIWYICNMFVANVPSSGWLF